MDHFYLYRITNKVNGKIYVGVHKTRNLDDGYMGSGKVIQAAIAKHGLENFQKEILETFENAAQMFEREKEVVTEEFLARDDTYNLRRGGTGGFDYINSRITSEVRRSNGRSSRQKYRKNLKEDPVKREDHIRRWVSGLKERHESGRVRYDNFRGRKHKEETKRLLSESARITSLGSKNSQFGTFWITDGRQNKKVRDVIPEGWRKGRTTSATLVKSGDL